MGRKYNPTKKDIQVIRDLYDGSSLNISKIMIRLERKYPRGYIKKLAQQMGLARTKEPDWNTAEIGYLLDHYHECGYTTVRNALRKLNGGLLRTRTAIGLKARRLGICKSDEGYTMRGACAVLGVDHHKIKEWVSKGYLRRNFRGTARKKIQGGDIWFIDEECLRSFIIRHLEEIDLRKVDKEAFKGLLAGNIKKLMTTCLCPECGDEYQRMMNWKGRGIPRITCDACRVSEDRQEDDYAEWYQLGRM